jgi:hypothetical protein
MEVERRRPDGDMNLNQFKRQFNNPRQFLKRENRYNEQSIQAPLKNENILDDTIEEGEFEDVDEEMNNLEGEFLETYVTQDEYEKSLNFNEKDNQNPIDIQSSQ